jgi:hypothetical protein
VSVTRIMPPGYLRAGVLATALLRLAVSSGAAFAADGVVAVTTPGTGELTMCRSMVVYNSCDAHKVILPARIAVGDRLKLTYGSNPKDYNFHVVQIQKQGANCTIFNNASGDENGEKIEVAACQPTTKPAAESQ